MELEEPREEPREERALPQLETEATSSRKLQPTNSGMYWLFRFHAITAGIILLVAVLLRLSSREGGKSVAGGANLQIAWEIKYMHTSSVLTVLTICSFI